MSQTNSPNALKGYMGNANLKRENVKIKYTKHQVQEIIKCKNDPVYFIQHYIKIVNVDKGFIPFKLYDFQKEIVKTIVDNRFVICKLPRQSGKCCFINSNVRLRNKVTGEIVNTTIGNFYNEQSRNKKQIPAE